MTVVWGIILGCIWGYLLFFIYSFIQENRVTIVSHTSYMMPFEFILRKYALIIRRVLFKNHKKNNAYAKYWRIISQDVHLDDAYFISYTIGLNCLLVAVLRVFSVQMWGHCLVVIASVLYCFLWTKYLRNKQIKEIESDIILFIESIILSVTAGHEYTYAFPKLIDQLDDSALKEELKFISHAVQSGKNWDHALDLSQQRVSSDLYYQFISVLRQSKRTGISISHALRELNTQLIEREINTMESHGAKAAQKAILPLVLCIMPATGLLIISPIIMRLLFHSDWMSFK